MTDYHPRELTVRLSEALRRMPAVVLSGLRQSGKSTLLTVEPAFGGRTFHTLDDFAVLAAARQNPETLLDSPAPLTLDEVQRCPELLSALKVVVDRHRQPGRFSFPDPRISHCSLDSPRRLPAELSTSPCIL